MCHVTRVLRRAGRTRHCRRRRDHFISARTQLRGSSAPQCVYKLRGSQHCRRVTVTGRGHFAIGMVRACQVALRLRGRPVVSDVLVRDGDPRRSAHTIVMFPGNPSVLPYYMRFMQLIVNGIPDYVPMHTVGHAGFSNVDHNRGELFDLDDQIDLKIAYLDALLEKSPASRFILMGHSVGSYMAMEVLSRRPDLPVDGNVFLFPALSQLEVAWPIRILQVPVAREGIGFLVNVLPKTVKSLVIGMIPSVRDEAIMLGEHLNAHTVRNGLALTRDELAKIRQLPESRLATLKRHASKSLYIFTPFDEYVPMHLVDDLRAAVPDAKHHVFSHSDGVRHAFVLSDSDVVAQHALMHLSEFFPERAPADA